jgi:endonuclease G
MRSIFKPKSLFTFLSGGAIGSALTYYVLSTYSEELITSSTTHLTKLDPSTPHPSMPYGSHGPESELIHRKSYTLSYNRRLKQANWISECLTRIDDDDDTDHPKRKNVHFKEDKQVRHAHLTYQIPLMFRAQIKDYKNSGFDRGHLAAAADFNDKISYEESFLLSNVSPQVGKGFNRVYWRF